MTESGGVARRGEHDGDSRAERDPEAARAAIRERAAEIREAQVAAALATLGDDVAPETEAAIESLADRLVQRLLVPPERALTDAEPDDRAVATAIELFGREGEDRSGQSPEAGSAADSPGSGPS